MYIAMTVRHGLNPYNPLSTCAPGTPTATPTAAPRIDPMRATTALMREHTAIPASIRAPEIMSSARNICPIPRMDPAKNAEMVMVALTSVSYSGSIGTPTDSVLILDIFAVASKYMITDALKGRVNGGDL